MKNHILTFSIISVIAILSSCSHTYYAPNTVPTPHLMDKNNAEIRGTLVFPVGQSSDFNAYEGSATYSPMKHLAVQSNILYGSASSSTGKNSGSIIDVAVGGYLPKNLNPSDPNPTKIEELSLATFVGTSFGSITNTYDTIGIVKSNLKFQKYFCSLSASYIVQRFKLGFGLRFNQLNFKSSSITNGSIPSEELRKIKNIEAKSNFFFPEMSLNIGLNFKKMYLTWGITRSYFKDVSLYNFNNSNMYLSLGFKIHEFFKK